MNPTTTKRRATEPSAMKRWLVLLPVGLVAGAVGFIGGMLCLLVLTGLDRPSLAPVAQLTVTGLVAGIVIGLVARIDRASALALAAGGVIAGVVIGLIVRSVGDYEWAIASALGLVVALAVTARSISETG